MGDTELRAIIRAIDATAPGVSSAKRNLGSLESVVSGVAGGITRQVAGIAGGFIALDRIIGATMAGIRNADALKDLHAQIRAVDGSITEAGKSLAYFDDAQNRTRRTGDDLAKVYGELLPTALSRGFSREKFREVVVQLDQFATRVGKMPEEINDAFGQIMTGNARDKNPILRALGLDAESVKTGKVSADEILEQIRRIADEGEAMGDDLTSTFDKVQDSLLDAFSKGWNDADETTRDGVQRIKDRVTDPELLKALEGLGGAIRRGLTSAAEIATNPQELIARGMSLPFSYIPGVGDFMTRGARTLVGGAYNAYNGARNLSFSGYLNRYAQSIPPGYSPDAGTKNYDEEFLAGTRADFRDTDKIRRDAEASAEAAKKQAAAIRERTEALTFEIQILRAVNPFQKAEAEFLRDVAAASREATAQLKGLALTRAEIIRQGKIDAAFGDLAGGNAALAAVFGRSHGTLVPGQQAEAFNDVYGRFGSQAAYDQVEKIFDQMEDDVKAMERAVSKWQGSFRDFQRTVGDAAIDFARTGGENLGQIAASRFTELTAQGFDDLFSMAFTPTQGKDGLWYLPGSSQGFQTQGAAVTAGQGRMAKAQAAFDFGAIGYGAYGASRNAEGARSGSLVSGAAAGAGIGAQMGAAGSYAGVIVGAVIGAIAGAVGGYMGEKARQDQYKYGVPMVDLNGVSSMYAAKNLTTLEQKQIIAQIQDTYERTRNAGVRTMMTLGVGANQKWDTIVGNFQPEASQNWGKHLQQWISTGLPAEVMAQMKDTYKAGFAQVGFGGERFDQMWASLEKLDPQKMQNILSGLAKGLTDLAKATDFFGAKNPFGGNSSWFTGLIDVRREMNMSFADSIRQQQGDVITKAGYLDDLVGEDQVNLLQEIGQMSLDIRQRERDEMRAILQLQDEFTRRLQDAKDKYDLMGMVKKDGTPDYERQAHFYQSKADDALKRIAQAKTKEEVDRANADYYRYIDLIVQAGYAIGPKTGEEYRKWALEQIEKADKASAAKLDELGRQVQKANEEFMAKLQPILDAFATAAADIGESGGGMRDAWDKFEPIFRDFKDNMTSANVELESNVVSLTKFREAMDKATARLTSASFATTTANMRANG